jgi:hypothetical protein
MMVRRGLTIAGWGAAGIVLSAALIAGAFAVAGTRLTEPAMPVRVSAPPLVAERTTPSGADTSAADQSSPPVTPGVPQRSGAATASASASASDEGVAGVASNRDGEGEGADD